MVVRGITPSALFRCGVPTLMAAEILRFQNEQMKTAAKNLLAAGLPLRQILMPYTDTVLMDPKTPDYYFGAVMILCGPSAQILPAVKASGLEESGLTLKRLNSEAAVTRFLSRDVSSARIAPWLCRCDAHFRMILS